MNKYQKTLIARYDDGYMGWVDNWGAKKISASKAKRNGDGLFKFLYRELSSREGCESKTEAIKRLYVVVQQTEEIIEAINYRVELKGDKKWKQ